MVEEARLEETETGLMPVGEGWFVVNARDARWARNEAFGAQCAFEGPWPEAWFAELGIKLSVLQPGQPNCLYHRESQQEDFLVLAGECLLLVEGQERPLKAWDFFHCRAEHGARPRRRGGRPVRGSDGRSAFRGRGSVLPGLGARPPLRGELRERHGLGRRGLRGDGISRQRGSTARFVARASLGLALAGHLVQEAEDAPDASVLPGHRDVEADRE